MLKKKFIKIIGSILLMSITMLGITACNGNKTSDNKSNTDKPTNKAVYEQITAKEAKRLMDTESNYIILDTRTEEEFAEGHIKNAILIPHDEILDRAEKELTDKEQLILVYCRSGNRSKKASQNLAELGYINVKEFGGIKDWQYEIVK
ncbi:MAG: rhodanese-like domain-containing protein [Acutalibacteraceae bacterium]|nr:rhodanese-like domain-containing protein [Acutalibacteraceae bacterium]